MGRGAWTQKILALYRDKKFNSLGRRQKINANLKLEKTETRSKPEKAANKYEYQCTPKQNMKDRNETKYDQNFQIQKKKLQVQIKKDRELRRTAGIWYSVSEWKG